MNKDSMAIIILCGHLGAAENVKPFEPSEWTRLADRLLAVKLCPQDILSFSKDDFKSKLDFNDGEIQRVDRLLEGSGSVSFEIEKYANMGINIMTRADNLYPKALKKKLGKSCPPLFYYAGDPLIADKKCVGFVGSRSVAVNDESFTVSTVTKINSNGYSVVSGGAKGVDSISSNISVQNGSFSVEYISDSLVNKIKSKSIIDAIISNRLLILSAVKPDAGFVTGIAMMRNNFIYAHSDGTVVVKADNNKGGTWNGAINNLKRRWCVTFCRNNSEYEGNIELIKRGAVAIDEMWDGDVSKYEIIREEPPQQLSLFDL